MTDHAAQLRMFARPLAVLSDAEVQARKESRETAARELAAAVSADESALVWYQTTPDTGQEILRCWRVRTKGKDYLASAVTCHGRLETIVLDEAKRDRLPGSPKAVVSVFGSVEMQDALEEGAAIVRED